MRPHNAHLTQINHHRTHNRSCRNRRNSMRTGARRISNTTAYRNADRLTEPASNSNSGINQIPNATTNCHTDSTAVAITDSNSRDLPDSSSNGNASTIPYAVANGNASRLPLPNT